MYFYKKEKETERRERQIADASERGKGGEEAAPSDNSLILLSQRLGETKKKREKGDLGEREEGRGGRALGPKSLSTTKAKMPKKKEGGPRKKKGKEGRKKFYTSTPNMKKRAGSPHLVHPRQRKKKMKKKKRGKDQDGVPLIFPVVGRARKKGGMGKKVMGGKKGM